MKITHIITHIDYFAENYASVLQLIVRDACEAFGFEPSFVHQSGEDSIPSSILSLKRDLAPKKEMLHGSCL
ncbi:MAG: hypothetical protein A4E44_00376 [Methanosaeta sp. PtaB.Bin018]|jgi:hypothetical protein|nr:MAG: hypothetical protein A4E44_00376 [Methanosaeta sp. PtaB.Bin018]OPY46942.1 MAG: hypothetical protein A4E46_00706 [Methanosaeta sp. PtaU1.Bin016]